MANRDKCFYICLMSDVFQILRPTKKILPIVLSIPHSGTRIPEELIDQYNPDLLPPDDTDWWVDKLYDFAPAMGITVMIAKYSRWVIDLNRNPDSQPLYHDGRLITSLCPTTNFLGKPIYNDERTAVAATEVSRRKFIYFERYHQKVQDILDEVKADCGNVLLWDCHSIRRQVPSIHKDPFPDLILGSVDRTSADEAIIDKALQLLSSDTYRVQHNHIFKGGYITRYFGKPHQQQHALQLEMAKPLYLDESETKYEENRATRVQLLLKQTLTGLSELLHTI